MDLWEVMLELREGNPLIQMSELYPHKTFVMWYIWRRQLIKFNYDSSRELQEITDALIENQYRIVKTETSDNLALMLADCKYDGEVDVWDISTESDCLELPPAVFSGGKGVFRIAGFQEENITTFIGRLEDKTEATLIHKKRLPLNVMRSSLWTSSILSSFSPRQAESLVKAQLMGYYETPRKVTTGELAKSMRIGRSTFEDHLRKAENVLVNSFVPYLKLFNSTIGEEEFYHQTLGNSSVQVES